MNNTYKLKEYTHCWSHKAIPKEKIDQIIFEVEYIINNNNDIELQGEYNDEPPVINHNEIIINGKGNYEYDIFSITFNEPIKYDECKTNKFPYDTIVCLILLSIANNVEDFIFASDGNIEYWIPIIQKYIEYFGQINVDFNKHFIR